MKFGIGRKHFWKRRKCWLPAFSPIPTMSLKVIYFWVVKSRDYEEFVDCNFKFDENSRKFSKGVKDTLEKGEIADYKQFLLSPQCFQQTCIADT